MVDALDSLIRMIGNEKYLLRYPKSHEFIGLDVTVTFSPNDVLMGVKGKVVDETYNTLKIMSVHGVKVVPKKGNRFAFNMNNNIVEIDGNDIIRRPYDRLKMMK